MQHILSLYNIHGSKSRIKLNRIRNEHFRNDHDSILKTLYVRYLSIMTESHYLSSSFTLRIYTCTHHPSICPWATALHVYIKVNRTNCLSVLSVICRQIVVSLFCYVLSSCPLDALAMTNIHNSMLRVVYLPKPGLVLFVFARLALYVISCRTCLIVNVLAFYTNADLIARLLRERLLRSFFIIILFLSYTIYEFEIITQQVYMSLFVLSIDGSASIANRHRTVQDKKTLKDRPSLSLVCVYYHLSKMCQWPDTKHPVSVFIHYPRKSKPTERNRDPNPTNLRFTSSVYPEIPSTYY